MIVIWNKIGEVADRMDSMGYPDDISREERIRKFSEDAMKLVAIVRPVEEAREKLRVIPWLEPAQNYAGEEEQNAQSQDRADVLHQVIAWVEDLRKTLGVEE
jgi:hypothetical protein